MMMMTTMRGGRSHHPSCTGLRLIQLSTLYHVPVFNKDALELNTRRFRRYDGYNQREEVYDKQHE